MTAPTFWRDDYRAPDLPSKVVLVLLVVFAVLGFGRGMAYVYDPVSPAAPSRVFLEALPSLNFWGYALIAGSFALLVGLVLRSHMSVWMSHVFLCALNVAITIMIAQSVSQFGDGFGELILPASSVCWHAVFIWLSRPNFSVTALEGR